ncbi:peptidylprolyl isomerase [Sporosarcina sp. A2]|uniref:peptidylprolyl isomerase n=1 Tax=Sporosarcina sp. A2 TaxID=3393449 RepID=UPI003D7BDB76
MKGLVIGLLFALVLTGCSVPATSLKEIKSAPTNVESVIDSNVPLQYITTGQTVSYVVFHSSGDVVADTDLQDNILLIKFNVVNEQVGERKPHIYKLTSDSKHDSLDFLVNGESQTIRSYGVGN